MKIKAIVLMLAAAVAAEAGVLVDVGGDIRLGNRQSRELRFPGVDVSKGRVVVEMRNRIDYPRAAGWCPCWQIEVNGKAITAAATRRRPRESLHALGRAFTLMMSL